MNTIVQLFTDFGYFLGHLLSPGTFAIATAVGGMLWRVIVILRNQAEARDARLLKVITDGQQRSVNARENQSLQINKRLDIIVEDQANHYRDLQMEILRLQLLDGMDAKRLSESEVMIFYDKYHAMGGNSFVTAQVHEYLEELKKEEN